MYSASDIESSTAPVSPCPAETATNRAITAVLAHRAGNYRDNKSAFEDYKISSRTYYKWKAAIDNNQPFNL